MNTIKFIGFSPDKHEKFVSFVMLMVASIVEVTWLNTNQVETELVVLSGADDEGLYFTRSLKMSEHGWLFKKIAETGKTPSEHRFLRWNQIKSIIYIGNYEDANEYLTRNMDE